MSGRNRKSGGARTSTSDQRRATTLDQGPGNAAQQQSVHGFHEDLRITRDLAVPQIAHAVQSLQIPLRDSARQDRLVQILTDSQLSEGHAATLVAHLQESQAQAQAVVRAAAEVGHSLESAMHQLHDDLVFGAPGPEVWARPDGQTVSVAGSAPADLIGALVHSRGNDSAQILAFVQRVHLNVFLDEEEELELPSDYESQTSGA